MRSRTSCFNKTVFRKNLLRFAPVWGVYTLCLVVGILLALQKIPGLSLDSTEAQKGLLDWYLDGTQGITWLLTPATVCLAVPLYEQLKVLIFHYP